MRRLGLLLVSAFLLTGCTEKINPIEVSSETTIIENISKATVDTSKDFETTDKTEEYTTDENTTAEDTMAEDTTAEGFTIIEITENESTVSAVETTTLVEISTEETEATTAETTTLETTAEATTVESTTAETTVAETTAAPAIDPGDPYATAKLRYQSLKESIVQQENQISAIKALPCINITTEAGQDVLEKNYVKSIIDVFNCDSSYQLQAVEGEVKVRGNSTADGAEKPYRIKFDKKHGMLGLNGGQEFKSWVLLRTYWNLTPDMMSFNLFRAMNNGRYFGSDCRFVNVYINGVSKGVYLLCDQIQVAKGRVDINEPKKDDTSLNVGYLLEVDNYVSDEHPHFNLNYDNVTITDINGETRTLANHGMSIKSEIYSQAQVDFIAKYTRGVYKIVYEACENGKAYKFDGSYNVVEASDITPEEAVDAVVDIDSVIDMLIISEIAHDHDIGEGSLYMAVDFSSGSKCPKLAFIAPWDYDWAYNYDDGTEGYFASAFIKPEMGDRSNGWFITFMKGDWFVDRLKEKWQGYTSSGVFGTVADRVLEYAKQAKGDLGDLGWEVDCAIKLTAYVKERVNWLNTVWG